MPSVGLQPQCSIALAPPGDPRGYPLPPRALYFISSQCASTLRERQMWEILWTAPEPGFGAAINGVESRCPVFGARISLIRPPPLPSLLCSEATGGLGKSDGLRGHEPAGRRAARDPQAHVVESGRRRLPGGGGGRILRRGWLYNFRFRWIASDWIPTDRLRICAAQKCDPFVNIGQLDPGLGPSK